MRTNHFHLTNIGKLLIINLTNRQMKKSVLFILILSIFALNGFSKSRTQTEALQIANSFYQNVPGLRSSESSPSLSLAYACTDESSLRSSNEKAYYYVFNAGNGFVIVSGDDRAKDILGYSDKGTFDINKIPVNLKDWLSTYESQIKWVMDIAEKEENSLTVHPINRSTESESQFAPSIAPLLGGILWDQGDPYNILTPVIPYGANAGYKTPTGCVATAMAQVMKYHEWPLVGKGSISYTVGTYQFPISYTFEGTKYDWANMTDTYDESSTQEQKDAVSLLMAHCGASVFMNYDLESGAVTKQVGVALPYYFGYDSNIQAFERDYFTRSEWHDIIKTELNADRPVICNGASWIGGHAFVCDGYDTNGLFHFNWGWSGVSNGYFETEALNPSSLGIGANGGGYNTNQGVLVGIQKPTTSKTPVHHLISQRQITLTQNTVGRYKNFDALLAFTLNQGLNPFSGHIALALYKNDGFVDYFCTKKYTNITTGSGYHIPFNTAIPDDIESGDYQLYPVYSLDNGKNWTQIRTKVGTRRYVNVKVEDDSVRFSNPSEGLPRLALDKFEVKSTLYQDRYAQFEVSITNRGTGEYNSDILLYLLDPNDENNYQFINQDPINIIPGETKTFNYTELVNVKPGEYLLAVLYDPANIRAFFQVPSNLVPIKSLTVEAAEAPQIFLTDKVFFPDASKVPPKGAELTVNVKNTGGYFNGFINGSVFAKDNDSKYLTSFGEQFIELVPNESKTIVIKGDINLDAGEYLAAPLYFFNGETYDFTPEEMSLIPFTLGNPVGIEQNKVDKELELYPNPVVSTLYLTSEDVVKSIRITDISGKQLLNIKPNRSGTIDISVESMSSGTYIIMYETDNNIKIEKFVKK